MTNQETGATLTFEAFAEDDETGFEIIDPIERQRYTLRTPKSVIASEADRDQFPFPVDAAVTVQTSSLTLPSVALTHIRDEEGELLAITEEGAYEKVGNGTYIIELHVPIKLYFRVESQLILTSDFERTTIDFGDETTVAIGARSYHHRPATTVTTTSDPEDVMAAISTFGSALKTTNPGRSYPTLRGHPPTIELGDELTIPNEFRPSGTAVTIEIPVDFKYIYPAAPLAYYLNAELVSGNEPCLHVGTDFTHALDSERGYENEIVRVLKQTFFLDCLTRTEGVYDTGVELHERQAIESDPSLAADFDFAALYAASTTERLASYLDIPFERIEPHLLDWQLTAQLKPIPASVETLPFFVNDLAAVRTPGPDDIASVSPMEASEFDKISTPRSDFDADINARFTRSESRGNDSANTSSRQNDSTPDELYVQLPPADSLAQAWVGEGVPINASKVMVEAYQNRLTRPKNNGDITVTIVCNDTEMINEQEAINEIYGSYTSLPFDMNAHSDLTRAELRGVFATSTEFLHYIGHIDSEGFACADGKLDATTLAEVNVDAFLLNTCHSCEQGMALIKAGSIGGIATLNEVFDHAAFQMGKSLARLLHTGFPLQTAVEIARVDSLAGKQYLVIGDGGLAIGQADSGCPGFCAIERTDDGFRLTHRLYPTEERGMGSIGTPYLPSVSDYYLVSGRPTTFEVSQEELAQFLSYEDIPVRVNRSLHWGGELDLDEL